MKNFFLFSVLLASITGLNAQQATKTTAAKTPVPVPILKNQTDSASYAIGVSVANYYKQMGVKNLNSTLVSKAINDVLANKNVLLDDNTCNTLMNNYLTRLMAEKSKGSIDAGEKFLAENKLRPGVKTTASGLQYEVITEGTGIKPTATDSVTCHYQGTLLDGTEVDNSYKRGEPITFSLGGVIKGWTEGLQLMNVGSKYKFYIPYQLGYGPSDYMAIPGGSTLIFEIDLLDVKKKQ